MGVNAAVVRFLVVIVCGSLCIKGNFLGVVDKCCRKGMEKVKPIQDGKLRKSVCEDSSVNVVGVSSSDMNMCQRAARTCCVKQLQLQFCIAGIARARKGRECSRHSKVGGDAQRECCDCCYLGLEARRNGQSCDAFTLTFPCDEAYRRCCKPDGDPGPIVIPTQGQTAPEITVPTPKAPVLKCAQAQCTHQCADTAEGAKCYCFEGYALQSDKRTCADRDECQFNPCGSDRCVNTQGSYKCQKLASCGAGYDFRNGRCLDRNECAASTSPCDSATETCVNTQGSYRCVPQDIRCFPGFQPVNGRCTDVDECASNLDNCGSGLICQNTAGSFTCFREKCRQGYQRDYLTQACTDINECLASPCVNARTCTNTPGSYECTCWNGWRLKSDRRTCEDIDECQSGQKLCHHRCVNVAGSYVCDCNPGYKRRASDKRLCDDIDECALGSPCVWRCENTPGSYRCLCPPRVFKTVNNKCEDVDECALRTVSCRRGETCFNTYGGFQCIDNKCPSEFFKVFEASKRPNSGQCVRDCSGFEGEKQRRCRNELTQSVRWWATSLRTGVGKESYKFVYRIQPSPEYRDIPTVEYRLDNHRGYFKMETSQEASSLKGYPEQHIVTVTNVRQLDGPKTFNLKLTGNVKVSGQTVSRFLAYLHIFISEYNLY